MNPKEKLLEILEKLNGQPMAEVDWRYHSKYAKQNIKRLAGVVIDEVIHEIQGRSCNEHWKFWNDVKDELNNF